MKLFILSIIFLSFVVCAHAQKGNNEKSKATEAVASIEKKSKTEEVKQIEDDDSETGEFVYRPRGRRDPFWDLLRGSGNNKIRREARDGIAGLEIDQLELEGIVFKNGSFIALFKGPNSNPYDVKVGQAVYDGEIIKIDANSVVFKKILTIALGGTKEKTIVKRLNPEKENEI